MRRRRRGLDPAEPPPLARWPDLDGWRGIELVTLPVGRRVFTCRKFGVTWQIVHTPGKGWRGTKMHGGQIIGVIEAARLPASLKRQLETNHVRS